MDRRTSSSLAAQGPQDWTSVHTALDTSKPVLADSPCDVQSTNPYRLCRRRGMQERDRRLQNEPQLNRLAPTASGPAATTA